MKKSTKDVDGVNCGVVIYDEVEQNLRETLGNCVEARQAFFAPIFNGAGNDIQIIGIDFSAGEDWSAKVRVRNPRLLNKEKESK
ncbi:hypothetical protein SAMN04487919_1278 [Bacillus sp. ok061]|uniref:hypothetical protein n=1 Tax=Bacillus sp. ok061 TaxID=1761766 RepID=UPI00089F8260|nr:hypothetical protein [Bacillus sp. ok061]SEG79346.1 hypothetical protein SAMN04487919_1278 [Bacillus sp. ok061]